MISSPTRKFFRLRTPVIPGPIPALLISLLIIPLAGCSLLRGGLDVHNPRRMWVGSDQSSRPRVMRYISSLSALRGAACYGLVLADNEGIPTTVLNLTAIMPELGSRLETFVAGNGFELADLLADSAIERRKHADAIEVLDPKSLSEIVLPVVEITQKEMETGRRVSIGVALNYGEHKEEADAKDIDKSLFPKFTATTGAYSPVSLGKQIDEPEKPVLLADYEAEIGCVVLKEIDLTQLPTEEEFEKSVAYFTVNDVSDREPIIRMRDAGFTQAKSHPTYQPVGPWMVHGRHLNPKTMTGGKDVLHVNLLVDEPEPYEGGTWRQGDTSESMIRGPYAILQMIAEVWPESARIDANGRLWPLVPQRDGKPYLPVGSIVMTGTPGGTAIRAPQGGDLFRLLLLGHFSMSGAKAAYVRHCEEHRREMGFLGVGDVVDTQVEQLGCQRWRVVE